MNEENKRQELTGVPRPAGSFAKSSNENCKKRTFLSASVFRFLYPVDVFFFFSSSVQGLNNNSRIIFVSFFFRPRRGDEKEEE